MPLPSTLPVYAAALAAGLALRLALLAAKPPPVPDQRLPGTAVDRVADSPRWNARAAVNTPRPGLEDVLAATGAERMRRLLAWLREATAGELPAMAAALRGGEFSQTGIGLLMDRWAELNPEAMLRWAGEQTGSAAPGREELTSNAFTAWARVDFTAAWAAAPRTLRGSVLLGLTANDPVRCLGILQSNPELLAIPGGVEVLGRLARYHPEAASALIAGASGPQRGSAAAAVALAWVRQDPDKAIAWLAGLPPEVRSRTVREAGVWIIQRLPDRLPGILDGLPAGEARTLLETRAFAALAGSDPAAAKRKLESMPPGVLRDYRLAQLLPALWRAGDLSGARELAERTAWNLSGIEHPAKRTVIGPGSVQSTSHGRGMAADEALHDLVSGISGSDPATVAGILAAQGEKPNADLNRKLAMESPAALLGMLLQPNGPNGAGNAFNALFGAWTQLNPREASAWLMTQPGPTATRPDLLANLASGWAEADPAGLAAWAAGQPESARQAAWDAMAAKNAWYAAARAPEFFAAASPKSIQQLFGSLSAEPETTRRLLMDMPDTMEPPNNLVMSRWLNDDALTASEWVAGLPPGAKREGATRAMVGWLLQNQEPDSAFAWAATLPSGERSNLLSYSVHEWRKSAGPGAPAEAIRASRLTDAEKQWLLRPLSDSP